MKTVLKDQIHIIIKGLFLKTKISEGMKCLKNIKKDKFSHRKTPK